MKILVGSKAINFRVHQPIREPKDTDFYLRGPENKICNKQEDSHGIPEEVFDYIAYSKETFWKEPFKGEPMLIPSLDMLYTIKLSHSFFPIKWQKTAFDIAWMKSKHNTKLDEQLFKMLYEFWLTVHKNHKHKVKLNKTNEDFFKDKVGRRYVHDDLHAAISYPNHPMYYQMKKDKSLAMLPYEEFLKASFEDQLTLAREEISVTALERFLIPREFKMNRKQAYRHGAEKLVTSMSKGWFPKFIMENWHILHDTDGSYVDKFTEALAAGRVRNVA